METRDYLYAGEQISSSGNIKDYDDYYTMHANTYNEDGFKTEVSFSIRGRYPSDNNTKYKYEIDDYFHRICEGEEDIYDNGKWIQRWNENGVKTVEIEYDENGREVKQMFYNDSGVMDRYIQTSYYENKSIEKRYSMENGTKVLTGETVVSYNNDGQKTSCKEYYYNDSQQKVKTKEIEYVNGGNEERITAYNEGKIDDRSVIIYNNRHEIIRVEIIDNGYKITEEYTRKYDQYGNPTLVIIQYKRKSDLPDIKNENHCRYVQVYNYEYYDGTTFDAKSEFPDLFLIDQSTPSSNNESTSTYPQYPNIGNSNGNINQSGGTDNGTVNNNSATPSKRWVKRTQIENCNMCSDGTCRTCGGYRVIDNGFGGTTVCPNCDDGRCRKCHGTHQIEKSEMVYE